MRRHLIKPCKRRQPCLPTLSFALFRSKIPRPESASSVKNPRLTCFSGWSKWPSNEAAPLAAILGGQRREASRGEATPSASALVPARRRCLETESGFTKTAVTLAANTCNRGDTRNKRLLQLRYHDASWSQCLRHGQVAQTSQPWDQSSEKYILL